MKQSQPVLLDHVNTFPFRLPGCFCFMCFLTSLNDPKAPSAQCRGQRKNSLVGFGALSPIFLPTAADTNGTLFGGGCLEIDGGCVEFKGSCLEIDGGCVEIEGSCMGIDGS